MSRAYHACVGLGSLSAVEICRPASCGALLRSSSAAKLKSVASFVPSTGISLCLFESVLFLLHSAAGIHYSFMCCTFAPRSGFSRSDGEQRGALSRQQELEFPEGIDHRSLNGRRCARSGLSVKPRIWILSSKTNFCELICLNKQMQWRTSNEVTLDLLFCFACTRHQGTTVIAITLIIFVHSYIAIKFTINPNNAIREIFYPYKILRIEHNLFTRALFSK